MRSGSSFTSVIKDDLEQVLEGPHKHSVLYNVHFPPFEPRIPQSKVDTKTQCHAVEPDRLTLQRVCRKAKRHFWGTTSWGLNLPAVQNIYKAAVIKNWGQTLLWNKAERAGRGLHLHGNDIYNMDGLQARGERTDFSIDGLGPLLIHTENDEIRNLLHTGHKNQIQVDYKQV